MTDGSVGVRHLAPAARAKDSWAPTGGIAESALGRVAAANLAILASGRATLTALGTLPGGTAVNSITFVSGNTAIGTPTNQWFFLCDQSGTVLAKTVDDTTAAWAATAAKTLALSAVYTPTADIAVYAGVVTVATTVPTLQGVNLASAAGLAALTPALACRSTTGLTTPASLGATAIVGTTDANNIPYAYVS